MDNKVVGNVLATVRKELPKFVEPSLTKESRRRDPFRVLISCIISLRTKDAVTSAASERLFALADTPGSMQKLRVTQIQKAIYPASFFRVKAKNIKNVARIVAKRGSVPDTIDELLELPNVGRKTANIVVTLGFNKPGVAVDTHVHRISNRLGYVATKHPDETEFALRDKLPRRYWIEYNDLLVTWGQNVCTPISPKCSQCGIRRWCGQVGVERTR